MKKIWKILGATALAVGLTPYRIEKDEETGEKKVQALLWGLSSKPDVEKGKDRITLDIGLHKPTAKNDEESHLFCDELVVDYGDSSDTIDPSSDVLEDDVDTVTEEGDTPETTPDSPEAPEAVENEAQDEPQEQPEVPEKPAEA